MSPRLRSPVSYERTARSCAFLLCQVKQTFQSSSICVQISSSSVCSTNSPYALSSPAVVLSAERIGLRGSRTKVSVSSRRVLRTRPYNALHSGGTPSGAHPQSPRQPVDTKPTLSRMQRPLPPRYEGRRRVVRLHPLPRRAQDAAPRAHGGPRRHNRLAARRVRVTLVRTAPAALGTYTLLDRLETRGSMAIYVAWFLDAEAGLTLADCAGRRVRRLAPVPPSVKTKQRSIAYGDEANRE